MGQKSGKQDNYHLEFVVLAGYVFFFCLALIFYFTYLAFITNNSKKQQPTVNVFATNLPPTTPITHITSVDQPHAVILFEDDFTSDLNHWARKKDIFKEDVADGKLYFESLDGHYAFTGCGLCPNLKEPFYLQADFSTTTATDRSFGIIFNLNYNYDSFYMFTVNTEAKKYHFYHHTKDGWTLRAANESDKIKSFPSINTLGVYANQDTVEFYVNGEIVDSYKESGYSFHKGDFSFYVGNSNFKLVVDNLVINKVGE